MRDFPGKHEKAVTVELTRNYRSTGSIVEWANRLMRNTSASGGAKSELSASAGAGWKPQIRSYYTEKVELEQIAARIKLLSERNQISLDEIAILLRYREDIAKVRRVLSLSGIKSVTPNDEFWRSVEPVLKAMKRISVQNSLPGREILEKALTDLRWIDESKGGEDEPDEYFELGQNLLDIADSIPMIESLSLEGLLLAFKKLEEDERDSADSGSVNVLTLHQSKGLEWDAVYIPRFVEGALPWAHAKTPEQLDEERRLAYVGITRARKFLEISWGETYKYLDKTRIRSVSSFEQFLKEPVPAPKKEISGPKTKVSKTDDWSKRFQPPPRKDRASASNQRVMRPLSEKLKDMEVNVREEFRVDLVLIQVGSFYEALGESAVILSEVTGFKTFGEDSGTLRAGLPRTALLSRLPKIESQGRAVAVVEQAGQAGKKMQREVRYVTGHSDLRISNLNG
jgi:superfamily I DNA/RNA helicase